MLRAAPSAVLVVHRPPDAGHERLRVLLGTDGSLAAAAAADLVIGISTPDRIEVDVRSVAQVHDFAYARWSGRLPGKDVQDAIEHGREIATALVERELERFHRAGFVVRGTIGDRSPADDLLTRAEQRGEDLLVVGSRGAGVLEWLVVGSVSSQVARRAPAALVVHARPPSLLVEHVEEHLEQPNGDVSANRYPMRLG